MKHESEPFKPVQSSLKSTPYEYKARRYRVRKVKRDDGQKEPDDLERFTTYGSGRKQEERDVQHTHSVAVRRHLRKKELEYWVRKNGIEDGEGLSYAMEVKRVKEEENKITYTFDMVPWEALIEEENCSWDVENRLVLDQEYDVLKWEEGIVYDDRAFSTNRLDMHLVIDVNDKNLLFDIIDKDPPKEKKQKKKRHLGIRALNGKYNISGDKNYIEADVGIRSTLGVQGVQHSIPALKLSPKLYKTYLTKEDLRAFHRPGLSLPVGSEILFSSLPENTSKPSSIIKKKKDLTLADSASYTLLEYSEEIPPLLANPGMASVLTTFYRKSSSKESPSQESNAGSLSILDGKDPSPFMFIGDVQPGESISAIINNLYKAPIFFHGTNDFLCIRTKSEKTQYYLREISSLACVGQTLPVDEVFSPHSRKHNLFCKNRLKVAAYRLFYEKGNHDKNLYIQNLDAMFPHFSEGSKRKWLKEYAEYVKKGKDNVWMLKPSASLLSEEDLRRTVTPEQVCQYESMLAEERRLKDAGVVLATTEDDTEEGEVKLALWNLTKNFISAVSGKGMLEISGPGDPTGSGEGFSFTKSKRKEREDEERKSISDQMQAYKDEIRQVWEKQTEFLRSSAKIERGEVSKEADESERLKEVLETQSTYKQGKVLSINRIIMRGDKKVQETELVSDYRVIEAYLKARKIQRREDARTSLRCGSCGQVGHMKTNKTCVNYKGKLQEKKSSRKKSPRTLLSEIVLGVLKELFSVPFSVAFHRPVSLKKFPNYLDFITSPIDLSTIKAKAKAGEYSKYSEFLDDVRLMNRNCNTYNGAGHSLTKVSEEMIEVAERFYDENQETISGFE